MDGDGWKWNGWCWWLWIVVVTNKEKMTSSWLYSASSHRRHRRQRRQPLHLDAQRHQSRPKAATSMFPLCHLSSMQLEFGWRNTETDLNSSDERNGVNNSNKNNHRLRINNNDATTDDATTTQPKSQSNPLSDPSKVPTSPINCYFWQGRGGNIKHQTRTRQQAALWEGMHGVAVNESIGYGLVHWIHYCSYPVQSFSTQHCSQRQRAVVDELKICMILNGPEKGKLHWDAVFNSLNYWLSLIPATSPTTWFFLTSSLEQPTYALEAKAQRRCIGWHSCVKFLHCRVNQG